MLERREAKRRSNYKRSFEVYSHDIETLTPAVVEQEVRKFEAVNPKSKGSTVFELRSAGEESKLIRGDYYITREGRVKITTDDIPDRTIWNQIFLPIDETLLGERVEYGRKLWVEEVHSSIRASLNYQARIMFLRHKLQGQDMMLAQTPPTLEGGEIFPFPILYPPTYAHKHTWSFVQDIEWANFV